MCGRYWIEESPDLQEIVEEMNRSPLADRWRTRAVIKTSGEIRPTDVVPVIAPNRFGERAVYPMKWGYTGKSLLINARSETAAIRRSFKTDWERHRCIVPASWYFEWEHLVDEAGRKHTGDKYRIWPKDSAVTWLCGLYRIEDGLPVFVVLTRNPGEEIRFIHERMPVIMPEDPAKEWIRPDAEPEILISEAQTDMRFEKTV